MQVFIDPDNNDTLRRNSGVDMPQVKMINVFSFYLFPSIRFLHLFSFVQGDNTYATIQHPNHHHHHVSNRVSDDIGDYETLTNNHRRPSSNCSSSRGPSQSHQVNYIIIFLYFFQIYKPFVLFLKSAILFFLVLRSLARISRFDVSSSAPSNASYRRTTESFVTRTHSRVVVGNRLDKLVTISK